MPAFGVADEPPVALGAERPGADQDRVDALAQAVEHLPVARVAEPARDPLEGRPAVGARDEVGDQVRTVGVRTAGEVKRGEQLREMNRGGLGHEPAELRARPGRRGGGHEAEPISRVINKQP